MIRAVITDLDNTLYSWVDFIVPSLEAMVNELCLSTGHPRIRVVQALKRVYERYGSNEYPFAIQESALFQDFQDDFASFSALVIEPARRAFSSARKRYLALYPGVRETLERLQQLGVPVVALTDAPRNPAERRIKQLGLDPLLSGLYTLPAFDFPETGVDPAIAAREAQGGIQLACPVTPLPSEYEKPDPRGLLRICEDLSLAPEELLVVGDNPVKDILLARTLGARDAWAEYGTYVSAEYRERLAIISAPSATRRHLSDPGAAGMPEPTYAISSFRQVAAIILAEREAPAARTPLRSSLRAVSEPGT